MNFAPSGEKLPTVDPCWQTDAQETPDHDLKSSQDHFQKMGMMEWSPSDKIGRLKLLY